MKLPLLQGIIDRRILANYRVDPAALTPLLPPPFRPKLLQGFGIAGICLIRLKHIRPNGFPQFLGLSSENAAHRIAVEWDESGQRREGVFIPRRDSSSRLNVLAGGRIFAGIHHHAKFDIHETPTHFTIGIQSDDGETRVQLDAAAVDQLPAQSIFNNLETASAFFQAGSLGYSPSDKGRRLDGLELRSLDWRVEPLAIENFQSSFFDNPDRFPPRSLQFDCALLMRNMRHQWRQREPLCIDNCAATV